MGWGVIVGGLGKAFEFLAKCLPFLLARQSGKDSVLRKQAEKSNEVKNEQLKIAARPNRSFNDILKRMCRRKM